MLALAFFVGMQGCGNVLAILAGYLGHFVHFGKAGLVANNAMATDTQVNFFLTGLGIALGFLGIGGHSGHRGDKGSENSKQQFVHFARTIGHCLM